jgi:transcriptional regulator with XRE-family HTH domain
MRAREEEQEVTARAGTGLGVRLRHARLVIGMTLKEVAIKADCSESLVSKIENEKIAPSLLTLRRIANVLGLTLGELFAAPDEAERIVSKAVERLLVSFDPLRKGSGVTLERLIPYSSHHLLQSNIHIIDQGGGSDGTVQHPGEELGFVLEGTIELVLDGSTFVLNAGDSFNFRSERAHGYRNVGDGRAKVLFVNTPPTF